MQRHPQRLYHLPSRNQEIDESTALYITDMANRGKKKFVEALVDSGSFGDRTDLVTTAKKVEQLFSP